MARKTEKGKFAFGSSFLFLLFLLSLLFLRFCLPQPLRTRRAKKRSLIAAPFFPFFLPHSNFDYQIFVFMSSLFISTSNDRYDVRRVCVCARCDGHKIACERSLKCSQKPRISRSTTATNVDCDCSLKASGKKALFSLLWRAGRFFRFFSPFFAV